MDVRFVGSFAVELEIRAAAAPCGDDYGSATYDIRVEAPSGIYPLGTLRTAPDGAFAAIFLLPPSVLDQPGARIVVLGSSYDSCVDVGVADCVGYIAPVPEPPR